MSRAYTMTDGLVVKTKNSRATWPSQGQNLHCTRNKTYWIEHLGQDAHGEYVDKRRAAEWLQERGLELPSDLEGLA